MGKALSPSPLFTGAFMSPKLILITFFCLSSMTALLPLNASTDSTIRVTGECKRKVFPDEEIYQLSFVKSANDNRKLQEEISKRASKLLDELKKELGKKIELQTNGFQSYPEYRWIKGQNVFQGFQARYSLEIKLTDFNSRDVLQKIARNSGAEEWSGPHHQLSETTKLKERDLCLGEAIEDARKKAEVIAKSANVKIQGLKNASEIQGGFPSFPMLKGGMAMMERASMDQMTAPPIEVRELDYQMTLEVTYLFK